MNVQHASAGESRSGVEGVIASAPDHIRRSINAKRAALGLSRVLSTRDAQQLAERTLAAKGDALEVEARGCGVWVNGPDGRLVPASTRSGSTVWATPRSTPSRAATRSPAIGSTITRVLILPAYGDAPAAHVRGRLPETIAPTAFGPAADLNRYGGWSLQTGHYGQRLAEAPGRLRAIDTPHGLVVEWRADLRLPWDLDAVRAIEQRAGVSVGMSIVSTRAVRLPQLTTMVVEARLDHIAILGPDERPAYRAATAVVFRNATRDDPAELNRQIAKLVAEARFRIRRTP